MSKLEVDKVTPQSGTTLTIGDAGDTTVINGLGTLPATIGSAAQVLSVNAGATGLQYGTAVTDLSNLNATNLTSGTVPDARFPSTLPTANGQNLTAINPTAISSGTLPALNAANLTNLNATNLTSGTVPDARFPATLPAISGANLTNLPGGGKVLQVKNLYNGSGNITTTSNSFIDVSGMEIQITPSSTSSRIYLQLLTNMYQTTSGAYWMLRYSRQIDGGSTTNHGHSTYGLASARGAVNHDFWGGVSMQLLDSPNTTSLITYKVQFREDGGTATFGLNGMPSNLVAMEIGA